MQLHTLRPKTKRPRPEPVGRGGKRGKTSGKGGKGQTARAGHKIRPEIRDQIKKLPKRRGYGRNRSRTVRSERAAYAPVNLAALEAQYAAGEVVSPASLLAKGLVRRVKGRAPKVKILGVGELSKAVVVRGCVASERAQEALAKAGATLER
ncbi:MAG: uL15 family ribosomal protein [Patescibacteria group bacterium]|nr:uL15 family ribosomal protein [Patescibacteria group bacterium]MDE1944115.1 uL15 family ribosomal protein [Patescibacteria group bacterium]MDE1945048.1 uL15 family ribosomal protein [Patescibacteria group bacterium]MDE2057508.1 uL15 family ribosomal protein [Patescibacteria group bacterium]